MPPYEVRCPACDVSFPPETRRCLHCGARTAPPLEDSSGVRLQTAGHSFPTEAVDDDEALTPQRLPLRIMSLVWVALAVAASFWRVCAGDGAPG